MDKITLFEQALHMIGDREYVRDSPAGKECDLWFPTVLHESLMIGAWSFAKRRVELNPVRPCVYMLPDDCLRLLRVDSPRYTVTGREVSVVDGYYRQGNEYLEVIYVSNQLAKEERLPETQPLFTRGVMLLLASRMAPKLASDQRLAMALEQQAQRQLEEALHRDVLTYASNDQHPLADILNSSII